MPGFADAIDEAGRWSLIDYLHANAAGAQIRFHLGEPSGRLAGMQLLIDSAGWIRERWNDGVQVNTASLMERIRAVRAKPLKMPAMAAHAGH
jgi:hypothetical protein